MWPQKMSFVVEDIRGWLTRYDHESYTCAAFRDKTTWTVELRIYGGYSATPRYRLVQAFEHLTREDAQAKIDDLLAYLPSYLTEAML